MARGGKRPNAGRKPGSINRLTALKLADEMIKEIKKSKSPREAQ